MGQPDEFDAATDDLKTRIREALRDNPDFAGARSDEWLRALYAHYVGRFLSDSSRIWVTGSIMIPLSLAGFAVLPTVDCPQLVHVVVLGIVSSAVMLSWLLIAENHRAFQDKSRAWIVAIEETIGLEKTGGPKIRGNLLNKALTFRGAVQLVRWGLTVSVIGGWVAVWVWWPLCTGSCR